MVQLGSEGIFTLRMGGAFAILDGEQQDVTPQAAKNCAIVAILAATPHHRMSRARLQSLLWGDFQADRAAANLRQAIYSLRADLSGLVASDRHSVWLSQENFQLEAVKASGSAFEQPLLDGLDIGEEAFEDWLRDARCAQSFVVQETKSEFEAQASLLNATLLPSLIMEKAEVPLTLGEFAGVVEMAQDELCSTAGMLGINTHHHSSAGSLDPVKNANSRTVAVRLYPLGNRAALSASVRNNLGFTRWSTRFELESSQFSEVNKVIARLGQEFLSYLVESSDHWNAADRDSKALEVNLAVLLKGILMPHSTPLATMQTCAGALADVEQTALAHALQGTLHVLAYGEQMAGLSPEKDAVHYHFDRALQLEPSNALVSAFAGHAKSFFENDPETGLSLTTRATEMSGYCPVSWMFHAISAGYVGDWAQAWTAAQRARQLSIGTVFTPFIESVCCHVSLMMGDYTVSARHGEVSYAMLPRFRPTALDLATSHALAGNVTRGRAILESFAKLDPQFDFNALQSTDIPFVNSEHRERIVEGVRALGAF